MDPLPSQDHTEGCPTSLLPTPSTTGGESPRNPGSLKRVGINAVRAPKRSLFILLYLDVEKATIPSQQKENYGCEQTHSQEAERGW